MILPSLFALEQIKKEAKSLKQQYPNHTHSQRLNIAAISLLRTRDYHEAFTLCKKRVNSFVTYSGCFAKCEFCEMRFLHEEEGDIKLHEDRHLECEKALHELGFLPVPYREREDRKRPAYSELANETGTVATKYEAALTLIRAYFDRSLEGAIRNGYWRQHPSFENFVAMISLDRIPHSVEKLIRRKYGAVIGENPINPIGIPRTCGNNPPSRSLSADNFGASF